MKLPELFRKKELESDEELLNEDELLDFPLEEDEEEEETEKSVLSGREKMVVSVTVFVTFLLFSFFFLPYELILGSVVNRVIAPARISFSSFDFNLFSGEEISNFSFSSPGMNFRTRGLLLDVGYMALASGSLKGDISLSSPELHFADSRVDAKMINGKFDLVGINRSLRELQGKLELQAAGIDLSSLNLQTIPIPLNELTIKSILLKGEFQTGFFQIGQWSIVTDVFLISISGKIYPGGIPSASRLDNRLCIRPAKGPGVEEHPLYGYYMMQGGTPDGELCLKIGGTLQAPSFVPESSP